MAIERIDNGGEIVLNRNPAYASADGRGEGRFNLGDLREFIYESEVLGADDDSCLWFKHEGSRVTSLYFKLENGMVASDEPVSPKSNMTFTTIAVTSAFWMLLIGLMLIF